jgi:hypothetical protein
MPVTQLSVFLDNTAGRLAQVTEVLGEHGVSIRGFLIADTAEFGVLRLIVNDEVKAAATLRAAHFTVHEEQVVVARVPDIPGGLACALGVFAKRGINVEYAYALVQSMIAFGVADVASAQAVLADEGLPEVTAEILAVV